MGVLDGLIDKITLELSFCRWEKALCTKICKNEVLIDESLPLDYAWPTCMYSRTLTLGNLFLKLE
jgi:hypothetical protein